jgi:hypothetical protein
MKKRFGLRSAILFGMALVMLLGASSCVPLVAGAAAGYVAHGEGYRVTNPIQKTE